MTDREAQELIRMVESNWHFDLGTARALWRTELMMWPADTATQALGELAAKVGYKINLHDIVETMEMLDNKRKRAEKEEADRLSRERGLKEASRYARPEWTFVWAWARFYRDPREDRLLPQQDGPPDMAMTTAEYETLREEWVAAGEPKHSVPGTVLSRA